MEKTLKKFNSRAFVALMITLSGLGLPITGVANHVYGFSALTVARHAWMSAHNIFGLLFIIFSIWHIVLNRRALLKYISGFAARIPFLSREAALAGAVLTLALLIFVGHSFHVGG